MSAEKFKVVARLGNSASIPMLINGEIGYDVDTKNFRVGDDTPTPPIIITSKSTGEIIYHESLRVKYGDIEIHAGKKVDGITLNTLNQNDGLVTRIADGTFTNRQVLGETNFIEVENPAGIAGDIRIKLAENVKTLLGGGTVSAMRFTYGAEFPNDPIPGHMHYFDEDETLYIFASQGDGYSFWLGISSFLGENTRYTTFFQQVERPLNALPGDQWYDPDQEKLFMMFYGDEDPYWAEIKII